MKLWLLAVFVALVFIRAPMSTVRTGAVSVIEPKAGAWRSWKGGFE